MWYVASSLRCYHEMASGTDPQFLAGFGVWPWLYVVQVGDNQAAIYAGKRLV